MVDRIKDVIVQGGLKISSVEVEGVLQQRPAVAEAAVFGLPDEVQSEEVAAAVVLRSQVGTQALREFVVQRLAVRQAPGRIAVVDTIPKSQLGKPSSGSSGPSCCGASSPGTTGRRQPAVAAGRCDLGWCSWP